MMGTMSFGQLDLSSLIGQPLGRSIAFVSLRSDEEHLDTGVGNESVWQCCELSTNAALIFDCFLRNCGFFCSIEAIRIGADLISKIKNFARFGEGGRKIARPASEFR